MPRKWQLEAQQEEDAANLEEDLCVTAELEELDLGGSKLRLGGLMALVAALPMSSIRVLKCARPVHTQLPAPDEHF